MGIWNLGRNATISLSSGLLQFVSDAYLITPNSSATSVSVDQNHIQLLSLVNQQQATSSAATAPSAASAQLADDTYTPSGQIQATQNSATSAVASASSFTLADLVENQTISGSLPVRVALIQAMDHFANASDLASQAFSTLAGKVEAQDYSGAQSALADYTAALAKASSTMSMSPLTTPSQQFMDDLTSLGTALQSGSKDDVQAAFMAASNAAPENVLGAESITFDAGDMTGYAAVLQEAVANMAEQLQQVGYTAANATLEANAIMLGAVADGTTGSTVSDQPQVDQWITDLAKAATNLNSDGKGATTNAALMSRILASMLSQTSVASMEMALTQMAGLYGSTSNDAAAANAGGDSSFSAYA